MDPVQEARDNFIEASACDDPDDREKFMAKGFAYTINAMGEILNTMDEIRALLHKPQQ